MYIPHIMMHIFMNLDWTLFFSALISSTLFPGGSEVLLIYRLHEGSNTGALLAIATAGNVLGSLITYAMGWIGNVAVHKKWLRMDDKKVARAETWYTGSFPYCLHGYPHWGNFRVMLC